MNLVHCWHFSSKQSRIKTEKKLGRKSCHKGVPGWLTSLSCVVQWFGISTLTTTVWLAQSIECETLNIRIMGLCIMLDARYVRYLVGGGYPDMRGLTLLASIVCAIHFVVSICVPPSWLGQHFSSSLGTWGFNLRSLSPLRGFTVALSVGSHPRTVRSISTSLGLSYSSGGIGSMS